MNRSHVFSIGEFYHLYNRGTDKRLIFIDTHDYHRFIMLLYFCNTKSSVDLQKLFREGQSFTDIFKLDRGESLVAISTWSLMPNHFHILVKEIQEGGISTFMRKVTTGYSMYFNKKYNRSGNLFQGKFKSEHIEEDRYLKYLFSYIHLNPIKLIEGESKWKETGIGDIKGAKDFLEKYEYSSFQDYIEKNTLFEKVILKKEFPIYFSDSTQVWTEMLDWLSYKLPVKVGASQI